MTTTEVNNENAGIAEPIVVDSTAETKLKTSLNATLPEDEKTSTDIETHSDEPEKTSNAVPENAGEASPVDLPVKTSLSRRLTSFIPFNKSNTSKKEEPAQESAQEPVSSSSTNSHEEKPPAKKTAKGFGTFFSRSKAKAEETATEDGNEVLSKEVSEPSQPTEESSDSSEEEAESDKEHIGDDAQETIETEDPKTSETDPTSSAQAVAATNKCQSFISKIFGKKKQDNIQTKEIEEETSNNTDNAPSDQDVSSPPEEPKEDPSEEVNSSAAPTSRPSSPLGRLTELFTSKKSNKKAKAVTAVTDEDATRQESSTKAVDEAEEVSEGTSDVKETDKDNKAANEESTTVNEST